MTSKGKKKKNWTSSFTLFLCCDDRKIFMNLCFYELIFMMSQEDPCASTEEWCEPFFSVFDGCWFFTTVRMEQKHVLQVGSHQPSGQQQINRKRYSSCRIFSWFGGWRCIVYKSILWVELIEFLTFLAGVFLLRKPILVMIFRDQAEVQWGTS